MQQKTITIAPTAIQAMLLRVAAYVRVSTNKDDQQNSFSAQYVHYKKLFEDSISEELVDVYADEGISGTSTDKRDQFKRLISDCEKGKIDRIYAKSISRFARNTVDCINTIRYLKTLGVTVYFEKENLDTALEETELRLTVMESQAQEESISNSRNVKLGIRYRMENGEYVSSVAPYGYDIIDRKLVVNEEEAKIVRRIFAEYLSGRSTQSIADELNKENVPRKIPGCRWELISVRIILSNERYIGDQILYKRYHSDTFPIVELRNRGEHDSFYIEDRHEPIVTREVFEQAKILREARVPMCLSQTHRQAFLSGRIFCSECGAVCRMVNVGENRYWGCRTHLSDKDACSAIKIPEEEIQRAFIEMYNRLNQNKKVILQPMIQQLVTLKNTIASQTVGYAGIDEKMMLINEQISIIAQLKQKGLMDEETYRTKSNELNNSLNSLRSKRRLFLNNSEADEAIAGIKKLTAILDKHPNKLTEFDEQLFDEMVEQITTDSSNIIRFMLIGGLKLNEKIERKTR